MDPLDTLDVSSTTQAAARSRMLRRAAAALALTAAGAISVTAVAESRSADAPAGASEPQAHRDHWQHHRPPGGPGFGMMGFGLPAGPRLDRVLDKLDATADQRTRIHEITRSAMEDLRKQHEANRPLRDEAAALFTQPQVDEQAAEAWRQRTLARQDQASRRMLQATLDISRVLTPEQRGKLGQLIKERQARMQERMERHRPPAPEGTPPARAS